MNILLDTHIFLWLRREPQRVSNRVLNVYYDMNNKVFLSVASLWEMQIKSQLGKLELDVPLSRLIEEQCKYNELQILPIEPCHIFALAELPLHHKDPFDRILLAQSQCEHLTLASADEVFRHYDSCSQAFSNVLAYLAQEEFASGVKNYPTVLNYISRPYWEIDPSIQLVKEVTPAVEAARKNLAQELLNREANVGRVSDVLASSPLLVAPSAEADRQYLMDLKLKLEQDVEKLRAAGFTCFSDLSNCESVSTQVLKNLTVFDNAALQSYLTDGLIAYFPFDLQHQSSQRPANSRPFAAQLFSYYDFQGNVEVLTEDKPFLTLNDQVYSVKVTPGCVVTLYDSLNYYDNPNIGNDIFYVVQSNNNLNTLYGWIKKASSAKVSCPNLAPNGLTSDTTGKYAGAIYGTEFSERQNG